MSLLHVWCPGGGSLPAGPGSKLGPPWRLQPVVCLFSKELWGSSPEGTRLRGCFPDESISTITQGCGRFCCPALSPANISVYLSTINVPPLALSQSCPHWQPRPTPHLWTSSISPSSELSLFVVGYIAHLSNSNRNNSLRFLTISPRAKRFVSVPSHLLCEVSVREFTAVLSILLMRKLRLPQPEGSGLR